VNAAPYTSDEYDMSYDLDPARLRATIVALDYFRGEVERIKVEHAADLSRLDNWRLRAGVAEREIERLKMPRADSHEETPR
jgi:hypothetical protein